MFRDGHQPLAGDGVILSLTEDGDEAPCTLPLDWVKEHVTFMGRPCGPSLGPHARLRPSSFPNLGPPMRGPFFVEHVLPAASKRKRTAGSG